MRADSASRSRITDQLAGGLLGLTIILLLLRYPGIYQDSVLYMGETLLHRWPAIFGQDLFFMHGSQGQYTLFPWLASSAYDVVQPPTLFLWGTIVSLALFAAAGWWCLATLLPAGQRLWPWLGVLCLPTVYGLIRTFGYSQQFFTPRPLAEILCLCAVIFAAKGRLLAMMACLAFSALMHPLQAVSGALVVWTWLVMRDRRWLHAAWLAIPVGIAGLMHVAPFDGLFKSMDPEWLGQVRDSTPQIFLNARGFNDWSALVLDVAMLGYAWKRGTGGRFAQWCGAALVALVLGHGFNAVFVDLLHLVLPAGLQLWRTQWLAHWFAMAAFAAFLQGDIERRDFARALLLMLCGLLTWSFLHWSWIPLLALYLAWPRLMEGRPQRLRTGLGLLFALGLAGLLTHTLATALVEFKQYGYRLEVYALDRRILIFPLIMLGLPLLGVYAWQRSGKVGRGLLAACLLLLATVGVVRWDARPPINRIIESNYARPDIFGPTIEPSAQVYWDLDMLLGTWLVLNRANYLASSQMGGIAFNRATAIDAKQRIERIRPLMQESAQCQDLTRPYAERAACAIGADNLRRACGPGASKPPDYLVLPYYQPQKNLGAWLLRHPKDGSAIGVFYLYSCTSVMHDLEAGIGTGAAGNADR